MATLMTENRDLNFSRGELKALRKKGKIPAVVYGKEVGKQSKTIFVNLIDFMKVYQESGKIMEMKLDGQVEMVNAKLIDRGPMGVFQHINFHQLKRGQKTQVKVPVHTEGESKGVKNGGILSLIQETILVEAKPKDIPESIHVDISDLGIGDVLLAGQIKLASGLELVTEADTQVLAIQPPQKEEVVEASADGENNTDDTATEPPASE